MRKQTLIFALLLAFGTAQAQTIWGGAKLVLFQGDTTFRPNMSAVRTFVLGTDFLRFTGPSTSQKTFTLPNASATILTTNAAVTPAQGGTGLTSLGTALQQLRVNAGATALEYFTPSASGDIVNGGNSTGATVVVGTNDANALSFETNGVVRQTMTGGASTGGAQTFTDVSSNTNAVETAMTIQANSSGTAAAGFGTAIELKAESSTTNNRTAGKIEALWSTATDASRTSDMRFLTVNSGSSFEALRLYGNSRAMVGGGTNQASAAFQVNSVAGGLLPPKMTNTEVNAISSPTEGLVVYNTTIKATQVYDGTKWVRTHQNTAPTIAAGTGAGTGPTISISGNDLEGTITLTPGSSPANAATVWTVTFNTAFATAPKGAIITAGDVDAAALLGGTRAVYCDASATTTTTWVVKSSTPTGLAASTEYVFFYRLIQ